MTKKLFPFLATKVENGVLLYFFVPDSELSFPKTKEIKYEFISFDDMNFCVFNDFWMVPIEILRDLNFKVQKYLYFMKYNLGNIYSEIIFVFEINEEFLINYKGYEYFLEYKKKIEKEKIEMEEVEMEKKEITKTEEEIKIQN
jgi:hypothetical protein